MCCSSEVIVVVSSEVHIDHMFMMDVATWTQPLCAVASFDETGRFYCQESVVVPVTAKRTLCHVCAVVGAVTQAIQLRFSFDEQVSVCHRLWNERNRLYWSQLGGYTLSAAAICWRISCCITTLLNACAVFTIL